ncbi:PIG-L family deacetylase [Paracoccus benzoatiresistens]|uniref:PIG-L family deacetylase n=1 Tax=Paracoccus benzoatiresistens TaxID=2997341 RepID=A0ABT4J7Z7_9RHOB|nr:PIG-L family deacetylase [Paracoccus sp. EF6]MCZ0962546.1 PIG-L family deacetylase [Paracoccus sp. EF6]
MTPDQERLARREASPALLRLSHALSRLGGVLTVMNTGAHPDDEQSGLMAWLRFGLGHRVVIACSTRGEGGQNALGPERGGLLGAIRTREMEEAARVLDCDVAWLGFGPGDAVHDFGFSKDGDATFARWGRHLIVARLARAYRIYRPDVVLPTFLDVPGQHGHHRAMTRAAAEAIGLAADPAALRDRPEAPWTVTHHYLPAWSGGGGTYDDALPPPQATLEITADAQDPTTGVAHAEIGQWSRARHASQGMGQWSGASQRTWGLHRVGGGAEVRLAQSLPQTLGDLADLAGPAGNAIHHAAGCVSLAQASFPDRARIREELAQADAALQDAERAATPAFMNKHGHRLARKRREIGVALAEAAGLSPLAWVQPAGLRPGGTAKLRVEHAIPPAACDMTITPMLPQGVAAPAMALTKASTELELRVAEDAPLTDAFHPGFDPLGGNGPAWLRVEATISGRPLQFAVDLEHPLEVLPTQEVALHPARLVRLTEDREPLTVTVTGTPELDLPPGWHLAQEGSRLTITPPAATPPGIVTIPATVGGCPAHSVATASYPHVGTVRQLVPATLHVLTLDLARPHGARIAYVGSGDSVGNWLRQLGLDVTLLDEIAPDEDFLAYTTVLVGVVAFGNRPDLAAATQRLHAFVRHGGHLVTLYQRPDQGWYPDSTPPCRVMVGTPSLRWRITDPAAPVTILEPDHPLLSGPNRIGAGDFDGWDKERGLYFAAQWADPYVPLLAMADPGEDPLHGALISGRIGRGRHTHTGLVLHHQMDRLVPGAFRLMCNLIQPA